MGKLSIAPSTTSSSLDIFPYRPAFGHDGQEIVLWANYFKLEAKPRTIYKYGLTVNQQPQPSGDQAGSTAGGADRPPREAKGAKLQRIITLALGQIHNATLATEFKAQVISLTELNLPASNTVQVNYTEPGRNRVEIWNVSFGAPVPIQLDELLTYLTRMVDPAGDTAFPKFPDELDALGVIVGHTARADNNAVAVGRGRFFATDARKEQAPMPHGSLLSIIRGYFQSVRPATGRLLLNVNVTHGIFRASLSLADMFAAAGINKMNDASSGSSQFTYHAETVNRYLNRAKISIRSPANPQQTVQRFMTGLARKTDGQKEEKPPRFDPAAVSRFGSPYTTKFFLRKPAPGSTATIIPGLKYDDYNTVAEYFLKKYNVKADRNLPLINIGTTNRPEYMLAEHCTIVGGQPMKTRLSPAEQDAMIKFACRSPPENALSITTKARELLRLDNNTLLSSFGLSVAKNLVTVRGRELQPPAVSYNKGAVVQPVDGGWHMRNVRVVKSGANITNWSFIYAQDSRNPAAISHAATEFGRQCRRTGLQIPEKPTGNGVGIAFDLNENTFKQAFSKLKAAQFVLVVLPRKDTALYNVIKKVADVDLGVPTVCVVEEKFTTERGQAGYCTNVALKLNLKMGGVNQSLQKDREHALIKSGKTMVVGYDVTHPTNIAIRRDKEGNEIRPPSMVGLVASVDKDLAQWPAESWSNQGGVEMLDERLVDAFKRRLDLWQTKNNRQLPENILIYRDGVSEGQFKTVLDQELPHIRKACKDVYEARKLKQPRITIIVSVKRHQTRFYPTDPGHIHHRSKSTKEGTVVDRGVTNVRYWDFFLQAHASLQGTARPAHYTVLLDEIFRADHGENAAHALETLTHDMCYLFGRATKAVSICPPAYYADLVCTRARLHKAELFDENRSVQSGGTSGSGTIQARQVHPNLKNTMYYI